MSTIGSSAARPRRPSVVADRNSRRCIRRILHQREDSEMSLKRTRWLPLFLCAASVTTLGYQSSPANRPWPPDVQQVSNASPPLSPAEALKTFFMPPGYRVELVAAEPLVQEPVALDWDVQGRLWVAEMPGFMADLTGSNEHDPIGR